MAGRSPNIQVSEVKYITAEAVRSGAAEIALKGKIRTILLPNRLCRKLQKYARQQKIASGEIFITQSGMGMDRKQIWAEMKKLCRLAGVERGKVYPHNLRSLFARSFYSVCHDVVRLADVLGHAITVLPDTQFRAAQALASLVRPEQPAGPARAERETVCLPRQEYRALYDGLYARYRNLYPALRGL